MTENVVVRARIDERTKKGSRGCTEENRAYRVRRISSAAGPCCRGKALSFEPLNPNAETVAAMKAERRGDLVNVGKPDKLLRSLNARD